MRSSGRGLGGAQKWRLWVWPVVGVVRCQLYRCIWLISFLVWVEKIAIVAVQYGGGYSLGNKPR